MILDNCIPHTLHFPPFVSQHNKCFINIVEVTFWYKTFHKIQP